MKKAILVILTLAYLTSTSGATIYIHQCMGKTISWDIVEKEADKCSKCGMHKNAPSDCCKDHVKVLKVNSDQNRTKISVERIFVPLFIPHETYSFSAPLVTKHEVKKLQPQASPPGVDRDLCVFYCSFLI